MAACPTCGKDLTWIPQYERFYCYAEKKYAPKGFGSAPASGAAIQLGGAVTESHVGHYHCPTCGQELTYIPQYNRYYCYAEKKYAPKDVAPIHLEPIAETAPEATPFVEAAKVVEPRPVEPAVAPAPAMMTETSPPISEEKPRTEALEVRPSAVETLALPETATPPAELQTVPEEIPPEPATVVPMAGDVGTRPPLKRSRIRAAKKPKLEEWSKAYGLDTKGSREVLRNRLLKYMDDQQIPDRDEVTIVEAQVPVGTPSEITPGQESPSEPAQETKLLAESPPMPETPPQDSASDVLSEPRPAETPESTPIPEESTVAPPEAERPHELVEPAPESLPPITSAPEPAAESVPSKAQQPEPEPSPVVEAVEARPEPLLPPTPEQRPEEAIDRIPEAIVPTTPVHVVEASAMPTLHEATPAPVVEPVPPKPAVVPTPAPPEPPVARVEVAKALACPNCGRELTYISRYDRLYCFSCGRYAPKGYGRDRLAVETPRPITPSPPAPVATTIVAPKPIEASKVVEARPENVCPTCGRTMRYVKEYQRWWCEAERKYAPRRVKNPCPTCGRELSYVRTYDRWYCAYEKKYAPKSYQAAMPASATTAVAAPPMASTVVQARPAAVAAVATTQVEAVAIRPMHTHRAPMVGVALVVLGYVLLMLPPIIYQVLPAAGVIAPGDTNSTLLDELLQLLGFGLAMGGTVWALVALRSRTK